MAVRKAGAKGASNPYEPRLPGDTRAVIMMAFSSRAFVHDDEAAAPPAKPSRRYRASVPYPTSTTPVAFGGPLNPPPPKSTAPDGPAVIQYHAHQPASSGRSRRVASNIGRTSRTSSGGQSTGTVQ